MKKERLTFQKNFQNFHLDTILFHVKHQKIFKNFHKKTLDKWEQVWYNWRAHNGCAGPNFELVKTNSKNFSKWHAWPRCQDFPEMWGAGPRPLYMAQSRSQVQPFTVIPPRGPIPGNFLPQKQAS